MRRLLLHFATKLSLDLEIEQFDVFTAFLNANIDEDIYMHSPPSLKTESQAGVKLVCKINRILYGIKQAPRSWQTLPSAWLVSYDFCQRET